MKIARFIATDDHEQIGRLVSDRQAQPLVGGLFGQLHFADQPVDITRLLPPVQPPNIFAIGRNYGGHIAETGARTPTRPLIFQKATTAIIGPDAPIVLPAAAPDEVDFEAELAIIIGRTTRSVAPTSALDHVLGYTCANDVSARDCQRDDKQWARAKGFDTFCPIGPWLVTPDEIDPQQCAVRSHVNGQLMQTGNTADMIFSCAELVSYLSHQFTLPPGTLILTGTPAGVGYTRQPPVFLRPGTTVEVEIAGIGTLRNPVVGPPA